MRDRCMRYGEDAAFVSAQIKADIQGNTSGLVVLEH